MFTINEICKNSNWKKILYLYPKNKFNIQEYHNILSPDFPEFLKSYIDLPIMQRLSGVGLLCGTDWTSLYRNRFYYSRLDHSIGTALIVWNFTNDKIQTLAALFHDISTPAFSHVNDFMKGDALTQTFTENMTSSFINSSNELKEKLKNDNIPLCSVTDYSMYPIANNKIPKLSSDRLEYMFPSGAALIGNWSMEEIKNIYSDIKILKNEQGFPELGFETLEKAEIYCAKFCEIGHLLQLNENKIALQLLAEIIKKALSFNFLCEQDLFDYSEKEILEILETHKENINFYKFYKTFRTMTHIERSEKELENYFCVNIKVKQRYIDPLVELSKNNCKRLSAISASSKNLIEDFLNFNDSSFGCVSII